MNLRTIAFNNLRRRKSRPAFLVAELLLGVATVGLERALLMGVDPEVEFHVKRWWSFDGHPVRASHDLVAGSAAARRFGLPLGQTVELSGESFTLTGILKDTGSQDDESLIAALPTAQRLLGKPGQVSLVEVAALCADCPIEDLVTQISGVLPAVKVAAIQQVVRIRMPAALTRPKRCGPFRPAGKD